jgi:hypothetical protein
MRVALSYFTRVTLIICILTSEINGAQAQQEVALESGGDELSVTTNPIDLQGIKFSKPLNLNASI